ncbi:MAG: MFS transporter [Gracilibacteraceae bacterium]|jgi:MFS family permease|nr:MFS transporter [Gracilibacteraceae bacterium]
MPDHPSSGERIRAGVAFTFRSLKYRNYRLFFLGQCVSLVGMWMQNVAMGWLVFSLTGSELLLGVVGFVENLPVLLLTPFVGVFVDRWNRHHILVVTQSLMMVQAFVLALLVLTGNTTVPLIMALAVVLGTITAVDITARQAFWIQIVDNKDDLSNAISLNSTVFNAARLVGPSLGGVIIAAIGEGLCFLLNAFSYIAVLVALLSMKFAAGVRKATARRGGYLANLKEGFSYAWGSLSIRLTLFTLACSSLVAIQYMVMLPVFAADVLNGNAMYLGYLLGSAGGGALVGAIYMARLRNALGLTGILRTGIILAGLGFIGFSFSRVLLLSILGILVLSFGIMLVISSCNVLVQTVVDDDKRGRVMGLHALCFSGMAPFGNLYMGAVAETWGAPATFLLSGVLMLVLAAVYSTRANSIEAVIAVQVKAK